MLEKRNDHLSLICDVGDLASMVSDSKNVDSFLQQVVQRVATNLNADVGSIYLYDESRNELVLTATIGLNPEAVGQVRMKPAEGLVGATLDQMAPICEGCATDHPCFKYFESADEERFNSFLSVPISLGNEKIGVLVVQHEQKNYFQPNDVMALRAIASQLAGTVANVRLMMAAPRESVPVDKSDLLDNLRFIRGRAAVNGFALAPAVVRRPFDPLQADVPDAAFKTSLDDFQQAVAKTTEQLKMLQDQLVRRLPESTALIFEAHHMILKDPRFGARIAALIQEGAPAPAAVRQVARFFMDLFGGNPNPYIQEKAQDVADLAYRLLFNLENTPATGQSPAEGHIVIAADLYPSDLLKLASEAVAGIVFVGGAVTSHVAIIARSLQIPMIITNKTELLGVPSGTSILMDAEVGTIYVNPSAAIRLKFQERNTARLKAGDQAEAMQSATHTRDGRRIELFANINLLSELELAQQLKAEGVGLYRSEFPFIVRSDFPSEEEQRLVYARLFEVMGEKPVYIRTLDVGGDKVLPYLNIPKEDNPELGLRAIRFSLHYRQIFDQQIRAILRAGARTSHLGIIFPLISSIDEFLAARRVVLEARNALTREGLAHHPAPRLGVMVETPALVPLMDELAREADFFSIGTNDFIQYLLAVDRSNENVASYYQPFHPAVLRSLAQIVKIARRHAKPIAVCGEVAHQTDFIPFLLGIGVQRLSVDPQFLPETQQTIAQIDLSEAEARAAQLLQYSTLADMGRH
jgi:phosphotransferase system enzyme I (PtsP)